MNDGTGLDGRVILFSNPDDADLVRHLIDQFESVQLEAEARRNILEENVRQMQAVMPWIQENMWLTPGKVMAAEIKRLRHCLATCERDGREYRHNTTTWRKNDLVLHDADAKTVDCLMRVIGYTKDGMVKTKYLYPEKISGRGGKKTWRNELKFLHDPERFGIPVNEIKRGFAA